MYGEVMQLLRSTLLRDTEEALSEDKAFLGNMNKSCALKKEGYVAHVKVRSKELVALAETIKVMELFKNTLLSAGPSFARIEAGSAAQRVEALAKIREAQRKYGRDRPELDFVALAIHGPSSWTITAKRNTAASSSTPPMTRKRASSMISLTSCTKPQTR